MEKHFELIKKFFETLKCSRCDSFFTGDSVQPVRVEQNNVAVKITCSSCGKNLGLAILGIDRNEYRNSLKFEEQDDSQQELCQPEDPITYEDVIEAHKFFSGLGSDWMKHLPKDDSG